jgi:hypothetical protein
VDRAGRARRRAGEEATPPEDADNPLPEAIDPITLEPVARFLPLSLACVYQFATLFSGRACSFG